MMQQTKMFPAFQDAVIATSAVTASFGSYTPIVMKESTGWGADDYSSEELKLLIARLDSLQREPGVSFYSAGETIRYLRTLAQKS